MADADDAAARTAAVERLVNQPALQEAPGRHAPQSAAQQRQRGHPADLLHVDVLHAAEIPGQPVRKEHVDEPAQLVVFPAELFADCNLDDAPRLAVQVKQKRSRRTEPEYKPADVRRASGDHAGFETSGGQVFREFLPASANQDPTADYFALPL